VMTALTWARALPAPPGDLEVLMLDVGQGEAIVVRSRDKTMLIDGGPDDRRLAGLLRRHGVHRIDLLVVTHPHADHIDGLLGVAGRWPVGRVLDPYIDDDLPTYRRLRALLHRNGVPRDRAVAGMAYRFGAAEVSVLWPLARHMEATASDVNNNSVVLRLSSGGRAVLFAGETQEEAQGELLRRYGARLRADVVKVSHHGSRRMVPDFYRATGAAVALIPVGPNRFGHPAPETLAVLAGMRVLRSDHHGTVAVRFPQVGAPVVDHERPAA